MNARFLKLYPLLKTFKRFAPPPPDRVAIIEGEYLSQSREVKNLRVMEKRRSVSLPPGVGLQVSRLAADILSQKDLVVLFVRLTDGYPNKEADEALFKRASLHTTIDLLGHIPVRIQVLFAEINLEILCQDVGGTLYSILPDHGEQFRGALRKVLNAPTLREAFVN
ncbi:hypothetical protein HYV73_00210 [Candidatus Uhrbacteria bacterium]|nr:hypothetical protein [Candidatus Uhrbacteria bacterium]